MKSGLACFIKGNCYIANLTIGNVCVDLKNTPQETLHGILFTQQFKQFYRELIIKRANDKTTSLQINTQAR